MRRESDYGVKKSITVYPCEVRIIPTGIAVEMPSGCEGQVRGRSGWTQKGLIVPIGTIDNHYRGEVKVIVCNVSNDPIRINPVEYVAELSDTNRGEKGLGSTGVGG